MTPILYRLRQSIRHRLASTAVLALTVAVMLGLVLTLCAGALRTLSAPDRYSSVWGGNFDALVEQTDGLPRTTEIAALPEVGDAASITFVFGGLVVPNTGQRPDALVFLGTSAASGVRLVEGREPDPDNPTEFAASRTFVEQSGARLGDSFELVTLTQEQADLVGFDAETPAGPTSPATLVGVFDGATELQDNYSYVVFPTSLVELGDIGLSATQISVALQPGRTTADLRAQLDRLDNGERFAISTVEFVPETVRTAIASQGQGLGVLALFAGSASIAVIGQLLGRQHRLSDTERLALMSIGMTRSQLVVDPLSRAAVPVVTGSVGASITAIACSGLFPTGFVTRVEPDPGVRFDPLVHVLGSLALAAVLIAWLAVTLTVASRERRPQVSPSLIERLTSQTGSVELASAARFAFTGTRHRRWPAASFLGITVVAAVVVGALTLGSNLARLIDEPSRHGSPELLVGSGGGAIAADVRTAFETDPDVVALALYGTVVTSVGELALDVTGIEPVRGDLSPDILVGRLPQSDDEIALGRVAARELGVDVGDEIVVAGASGAQRLVVSGLAVIPGVEGGDGLGEGGLVTAKGLERIDPAATMNVAGLELRRNASADTIERISNGVGMMVGPGDRPSVILNLDRVRSIPVLVAATLSLLAVLSLGHQLVVSAGQRTRDIGVLKALGADRASVSIVVHLQAMLFTAAAAAVAVPLGVIAGQSVYRLVADDIGARPDATVPGRYIAAAIILPVIIANVVAVLPARTARRLRPAMYLNQE